MAEEKANNESVKTILADEQLSDILLIIDKKNKSVDAVKKIDDGGKVETTPADGPQNEFLHIGHNSDLLDVAVTAIRNFYSQTRDPTQFAILKVPAKIFAGLKDTALLIRELAKSNPDKQARDFAEKYQVGTGAQTNSQSKDSIHQKNENMMEKKEDVQHAAAAAVEQPDNGKQNNHRFNEAMIDWKSIEGFGVSRKYLEDKGLLDSMLKGHKTSQLIPLSLKLGDAAVIKTDARLSFQQSVSGPVVLAVHGLRQEPQLQRPFLGHIFSEEDKKNLLETGNMGRSVELKNRNNEYHPYLVSIDKMTNEIVATRADKVFIPDTVSGVELTKEEKELLREGKKVFIDGMVSKGGKEFSAEIQINADRRGIEYIFPKNDNQNVQMIGGVELTPKQAKDLSEGRAVFVEDMKRAGDGELFSSFIKNWQAGLYPLQPGLPGRSEGNLYPQANRGCRTHRGRAGSPAQGHTDLSGRNGQPKRRGFLLLHKGRYRNRKTKLRQQTRRLRHGREIQSSGRGLGSDLKCNPAGTAAGREGRTHRRDERL